MLPTECRNVFEPTPAIPGFANAGLDYSVQYRAEVEWLPFLVAHRRKHKICFGGIQALAPPFRKGVFQCRMHRQRLCRRFRLARLQVSSPPPIVGMFYVEGLVGEIAI